MHVEGGYTLSKGECHMELKLKINGDERLFESGKITMKLFRKATRIRREFMNEELFGVGYPESDFDKAISFIVEYFGNKFTIDEFWDGFEINDSTEFFSFFLRVLNNIETNEEKQEFFNQLNDVIANNNDVKDSPPSNPKS